MKQNGSEVEMDEDMIKKGAKILYTTLIQYTKGDAKSKVSMAGMENSMDSYRHITQRGTNNTIQTQMMRRMKVMNPEAAKNVSDVEAKVNNWKSDIRILMEIDNEQDKAMYKASDQMITILLNMLPDQVSDYLVEKYEVGSTTLDQMESTLSDYLTRFEQKSKSGKKINQVASNDEDESEDKEEWKWCNDAEFGEYWLCTAAKRARTDD